MVSAAADGFSSSRWFQQQQQQQWMVSAAAAAAAADGFSSSSSSSSSGCFHQQQQQRMISAAAAELLHDQELTTSRCVGVVRVLEMSQQCLAGSQTSLPHNMPEQCTQTCVQQLPHQMARGTCATRSQMCWQCHCHEACSHAFVHDAANTTLDMLQVNHAAANEHHAVRYSTHIVFRPDENGVVELGGCTWGTHCRS